MALVPLTTAAAVKALHKGLIRADTEDTIFAPIILGVSQAIEQYLGYELHTEARTEELDVAVGQHIFALATRPLTSVASVRHSITRDWTVAAIDSVNYHANLKRGVLRINEEYALESGFGVLRVVHTGGLGADAAAIATAHPAIALAAAMQVVHFYTRAPEFGVASGGAQGGSRGWDQQGELIPEVLGLLRPYERH